MPKSSSQAPLQLDRSEEKLWALAGIGDRIQRARLDAGMSIEQVASALNITSSAVRQWELGRKFPSRPRLEAFARVVGADLGWLQTAVSDVARLADESGRALGHPVPILERHQIAKLELELPFSADFLKQVPWVWPSYPCSDQTFAFKVFDDWNAPEFQAEEVVLIDPKVEPMPGDMAVAVVDVDGEVVFGRIMGLSDADVRQVLEQLKAIARQSIKEPERAKAVERDIKHYDRLLQLPGRKRFPVLQSLLEPLNPAHPVIPAGAVSFVGVMVQHNRRPPPYSGGRPRFERRGR